MYNQVTQKIIIINFHIILTKNIQHNNSNICSIIHVHRFYQVLLCKDKKIVSDKPFVTKSNNNKFFKKYQYPNYHFYDNSSLKTFGIKLAKAILEVNHFGRHIQKRDIWINQIMAYIQDHNKRYKLIMYLKKHTCNLCFKLPCVFAIYIYVILCNSFLL